MTVRAMRFAREPGRFFLGGRAQKKNNLYFRMAHKKGAGHLLGGHMAKEHGFIDAQRHGRALDRGERTIAMPHLMWRVRPGDSLAGR